MKGGLYLRKILFAGFIFAEIWYNTFMKKIWINKANSFKEAAEFDLEYYIRMSRSERISTMQFLREIYHKLKVPRNGNGKRLRRIIKVI